MHHSPAVSSNLFLSDALLEKDHHALIITNRYRSPLIALGVDWDVAPSSRPPDTDPLLLGTYMTSSTEQGKFTGPLLRYTAPIPPGLSLVYRYPLDAEKGGPLKASLAAAVWEDGSWYGSTAVIARIRDLRQAAISGYDSALELLGKGLGEKWSRERYTAAMQSEHDRHGGSVNTTGLSDQVRELIAARRAPLMFPWAALQGRETGGTQAELDEAVRAVMAVLSEDRERLTRQLSVWPVPLQTARTATLCGALPSNPAEAKPQTKPN